ncbi:hypothetical protein [Actinacidiphila glaucinigra]|uniref:hypothetical protein n=1 Tax=Actinacidiphila glaucinigra TaxID=235986 RepID=UPI002E30016E|nr:hypothetical protein [Actinacidiphila glaucinigra]
MSTDDFVILAVDKEAWEEIAAGTPSDLARPAPGVRSFDLNTFQEGVTILKDVTSVAVPIIVARSHLARFGRQIAGWLKRNKSSDVRLTLRLEGRTHSSVVVGDADEEAIFEALLEILQELETEQPEE